MVAGVNLFHAGEERPESLANFTALPALSDTTKTWDSFNAYVEGDASGPAYGDRSSRRLFWSFSVKATPEAVRLVNTTFIARAAAEFGTVPNVLTSLTYQTIIKDWVAAARKAGGDALDLDPNDGNFFLMLVSTTWGDESLDEKISAFSASVTDEIVSKAKQQGLDYPFAYINDAGQGQRIFDLYGKGKSLPRLKAISRHYDPCQLFQKYQGGRFKLN